MKKKKMDWPIKSLDHIGTLFFQLGTGSRHNNIDIVKQTTFGPKGIILKGLLGTFVIFAFL